MHVSVSTLQAQELSGLHAESANKLEARERAAQETALECRQLAERVQDLTGQVRLARLEPSCSTKTHRLSCLPPSRVCSSLVGLRKFELVNRFCMVRGWLPNSAYTGMVETFFLVIS